MSESPVAPRHVYLVDGSGFIFRAFHALPPLNRADGTPVNAVLGFSNMLYKLVGETDADHIAVIFDASRITFRNRLYDQYKAQRPEAPPELIPQFRIVREATEAFNIAQVEMVDYEADDLIATYARLARAAGAIVTIVSSDKDLMQLVGDGVAMYDPLKQRAIGPDEVREKFGVGPEQVVDVQALCGDSVDNVPGVPGIGVKTAAELINTYGDLETLLSRAPEIKQPKRRQSLIDFAEQARISRALVELKSDVEVPVPLADLGLRPSDPGKLLGFLQAQGFRQLASRVQTRHPGAVPTAAAPMAAPSEAAPSAASSSVAPVAIASDTPQPPAQVEKRYELVQTEADLDRWIARAEAEGVVAFDTETNSLDAVLAELVGISLAVAPGEACYIPVGHVGEAAAGELNLSGAERPPQIPLDTVLARLKPLLEAPAVLKVGHNAKYDIQIFRSYGIEVAPVDCTMLLANTLEAGAHGMGMDELALIYFDYETIKYKDVAGSGKSHKGFAAVPLEAARDYAAEDADITLRLHRLLKPRVGRERMATVYETIERPLMPVVAAMERAGIKVDRAELLRLSADFGERMVDYEKEIHVLAGGPFNIGSPKQLGEVLFEKLGLPGGKKGKNGAYGTDAGILEDLAQTHDLPRRVLDWRQLAKLKSTYADALVEQINPKTGRVHTSYSLAGAATGRLASTDPNLQNIPVRTEEGRKIRRAFVSEPGHVLMSADYSQIELRLAAHVAGIEALKQAFRNGDDIHAMTASQVFGVPVEGMDPMVRRRAKAINFGIIYGISGFGLAQQLSITPAEASEFIKAYFQRFPEIRNYMDETKAFCREHGYVKTIFGRKCHLPGIKDSNPARRAFSERAAINAPLQGAAADIIKRAMIRLPARLAAEGLKARMLLQVHDELVFEVPESETERTIPVLKEVMEGACAPVIELSVPLVVEVGQAHSWDEAH
ncbi:DNA polymerase I [Aliidongia dinghuensis]|uniref:DNA polymerase I n=1 Tax=Aliidongia dinghuensis TaxID=1867774 RepID=A0A8J3E3X4_9PROT|nr:DNA polymerase I [Aliidongia dinghuensis]GGF22403.1 DNA polymerase I [Aliidongia dinghuensis]